MRDTTKRTVAIVFAVLLVGLFAIVAAAQGLGSPSVPDGSAAVVEEVPGCEVTEGDACAITEDQFNRSLEQVSARQGLREVPAPDDPQYELLRDTALGDLLLAAWVRGEAAERGIEISEREVDEELETVKSEQFGSEKEFQRFLEQSGFTPEEARERIELQLISSRVQEAVLPEEPPVTEDEIETFYEQNIEQFEQPESRDVRVILTPDEADAEQAFSQLSADPSPKTFDKVAQEFSTDEATKDRGGLREGVVAGQTDPTLEEQIFSAPLDQVVGPFETDAGFAVIRVENVTPSETTPLSEASEQIRTTLLSARQQEIAAAFQEDFLTKWTERTFCADDLRIDRCANAEPPADPCTEEIAETQGCDAPVASIRPIQPGTAGVFGAPAAAGLPQGPITPAGETPEGLPPGLTPLPGGTAPPGATPGAAPGAAPGATPQAAPPGG